MGNKTFNDLPDAGALTGAEKYPFWQGGVAVKKVLPNPETVATDLATAQSDITTAQADIAALQGDMAVTTKGDILGFSTVPARVPVGADDQVLVADSTQALGVKWGNPAAFGSVPASSIGTIANLRDYGVSPSSDPFDVSKQIAQAFVDVGYGGTVVVPNYGASAMHHRGIIIPPNRSFVGENPRGNYSANFLYSYLVCDDNTIQGVRIQDSVGTTTNFLIRDLTIAGGYDSLALSPGGSCYQYAIENCAITGGPFTRSCLYIRGFHLDAWMKNCIMKPGNAKGYGIFFDLMTVMQSIHWIHNWVYGTALVNVFANCESTADGGAWQDFNVDWFRNNGSQYAAFALRIGCGLQNSRFNMIGTEQSCQAIADPNKCDFIIDGGKYGGIGNPSSVRNIISDTSLEGGSPSYPIIVRSADVEVDDTGFISVLNNAVGCRGRIVPGIDYGKAAIDTTNPSPADPGVAVYGSLDATIMPLWEIYPAHSSKMSTGDVAVSNGFEDFNLYQNDVGQMEEMITSCVMF